MCLFVAFFSFLFLCCVSCVSLCHCLSLPAVSASAVCDCVSVSVQNKRVAAQLQLACDSRARTIEAVFFRLDSISRVGTWLDQISEDQFLNDTCADAMAELPPIADLMMVRSMNRSTAREILRAHNISCIRDAVKRSCIDLNKEPESRVYQVVVGDCSLVSHLPSKT